LIFKYLIPIVSAQHVMLEKKLGEWECNNRWQGWTKSKKVKKHWSNQPYLPFSFKRLKHHIWLWNQSPVVPDIKLS